MEISLPNSGTDANRLAIIVAGQDAPAFLQGLITQDVTQLNETPVYSFLLTPNGRVLFDFYIMRAPDAFKIDVAAAWQNTLTQKLQSYILRKKVTLISPPDLIAPIKDRMYELQHNITNGIFDFMVGEDTVADIDGVARGAISLTKGCYMGQELTARAHLRGLQKRKLVLGLTADIKNNYPNLTIRHQSGDYCSAMVVL